MKTRVYGSFTIILKPVQNMALGSVRAGFESWLCVTLPSDSPSLKIRFPHLDEETVIQPHSASQTLLCPERRWRLSAGLVSATLTSNQGLLLLLWGTGVGSQWPSPQCCSTHRLRMIFTFLKCHQTNEKEYVTKTYVASKDSNTSILWSFIF